MKVKAVLFDLDGVLVDSEPISTEASDRVLASVGIFLSDEERSEVFGKRTIDNYRRHIKRRELDLDAEELTGGLPRFRVSSVCLPALMTRESGRRLYLPAPSTA